MPILRNQPLFVILLGITSLSMLVPVLFSLRLEQWLYARIFFYHSLFIMIVTILIGIALSNRQFSNKASNQLFHVFSGFIFLPILMAMPVAYLVPQISFISAYFEMVSCLTTTGASVFDHGEKIPDVIHLWRGLTAWMGGLFMLVVALAIFMPIHLGGFEVYARNKHTRSFEMRIKKADIHERLFRYIKIIFPVYALLTGVLCLFLIISGDRLLVSFIHAMSTVSTSGISPIGGLRNSTAGYLGEFLVFMFMFFAVSRHFWMMLYDKRLIRQVVQDKELNMILFMLAIVPLLLFMRHWLSATEANTGQQFLAAFSALWGSVFTVLSYLTTTGFESASWNNTGDWSGLQTSGLILMGLCMMGGGIATTAGGIKLLRVYALYKHGLREMHRLSYPHSVGGSGMQARSIRRQGAYAAWIFFMLFLLSIAFGMLLLSLTGVNFEDSLILTIASLSTTGPLLGAVGDNSLTYSTIPDASKMVLCGLMILGRLEALAVVAILNPNYWRK